MVITTSRRTSRKTRAFIRDLSHVIPGSKRVNRGKKSVEDLRNLALAEGLRRVLIVETLRGNPSILRFLSALPTGLEYLPVLVMRGVSLRRELSSKRAPPARTLRIACVSPRPRDISEAFVQGFGTEELIELDSLDGGPSLTDYCDIALIVSPTDERTAASFYQTRPFLELGPKMYVDRVKSVVSEDHSDS